MTQSDLEVTRRARCEITRRYVDASRLDVSVMHGVIYLRGSLSPLRGHGEVDLKHEAEVISQLLHRLPAIRQVVWEAELLKM